MASEGRIGEIVLEVNDLQTYFVTRWGVVKAVDGVSFNLRKGETLGIVGESGSGKSVTVLSMMRLVPSPPGHIVGGEVFLEGENILELPEKDMEKVRGSRIAMVLQDPMTALNPVFDIEDQVGEALKIHEGLKGQSLKETVVDMLRKVRIPAPDVRMKDYPHQLSGGMRQRVVGAIGISCNPAVLIADEPTTSLDATIQAQYLRLLRELQESTGVGIIFITHDFGIVAKMCDRVAVMYAGKIVEQGDVRQIFNNPQHPYTEALINSVPKMEENVERLYSIPGNPPNLWELETECSFADRCPKVMDKCREAYPPTYEIGQGQVAACWLLEENAKTEVAI
ncbi:MAG: ABC transporter ATP-binding protein [SAR202 cluster bacterium]|nr:ABC transporter ATP-binding protein [SAR202 cluster bacterium]HAE33031.1 dipeptide/oligopeptide/nickel ABC transporter ATP-binding protein [Dehalococcoidia bacterium]|tara:strand:- start:618 stop:1631 length:1014 start_codon:yes stop_codon:yes gene_type:complete